MTKSFLFFREIFLLLARELFRSVAISHDPSALQRDKSTPMIQVHSHDLKVHESALGNQSAL